jgi:predicted AAA+ superfamily ATPase
MIYREIIPKIESWIGERKILVLKGSRQVGKTTILRYLQEKQEENGTKTLFFSADRELGNPLFASSKNFAFFLGTQIPDGKKLLVFIDEFQFIPNAGLFLKGVFDEIGDRVQILVSGSSSLEITKNTEFLTGRKVEFEIRGLSFFEYVNSVSKYSYARYPLGTIRPELFDTEEIRRHLLTYLNYGSYPEVCTTLDPGKKDIILDDIITTYISRDISGFMRVDAVSAFNNLLRLLSHQSGNVVNKSELANTLDIPLRKIEHYIDILEGTYVLDLVRPYFRNPRKEISKMPKVYFENLGVLHFFQKKRQYSLDTLEGNVVENFIYCVLLESFRKEQIAYYRTISKSEIDFIVETSS